MIEQEQIMEYIAETFHDECMRNDDIQALIDWLEEQKEVEGD